MLKIYNTSITSEILFVLFFFGRFQKKFLNTLYNKVYRPYLKIFEKGGQAFLLLN